VVRLGQNTQLRLRRKSPTSRPIRHLGRRRRRGRHYARSPVTTSPGSTVGINFLVLHDHDGCPSPSRLNFKDSDVSPSLARRDPRLLGVGAISAGSPPRRGLCTPRRPFSPAPFSSAMETSKNNCYY